MTPALLDAAAAALTDLLTFAQPADVALSAFFRSRPKLGGRDRTFIAEAVYGVIRRLRSLEQVTASVAPRTLLLAWLARHGGHTLREFEAIVAKDEMAWLKAIKAARLDDASPAIRLDLPDWLYERLAGQYGDRIEALMAALGRPAPLDLRVSRMSREAALTNLMNDDIEGAPTPWSPWGLRLKGKPALNKNALFLEGVIEVQDEGSQLLALLTGARRGEMVCDFCAGAGGKTLALGAMMKNTGRLYAFDVAEKRLANLKPRLARSQLSNVQPQLIANENDIKVKRLAGKFDRVLVDAPCSGLGTLRRNPYLKWQQTPESVLALTAKQAAILASAARLVKTGGRLVYATCSLLPEENEAVVENFLAGHPDFALKPAAAVLAEQGVALEMGDYLRLDPEKHGTDGFFAAVLERCE
ncbi:MAG: SAM-dependent methyltransferase [Hydrogenophilales bacterium CG03_land_8_20_14_0_80_62_28]|nr:RsmB/NOP family class I SAM-dependent RNA methyltransferase [Betaproteobacteria bacterium]OIO78884.1 MAG: SAM-dependent methyltransferase [Hydrogenophilaceae bacterium CG1_02_62_390]PIV21421.1 MAG: SAM-dependent methyltransferase [Hydrogenophilales bacterium CG03_land_8_20_14_0_80_62_28]PIW38083.1 MAG: SAM-dependent methyltransferase [Hydrogenophilales bacterium CG15_BIG_FIL_POST_REV_8_21_14_020_62_31]PIW72222.1 MAG: SAM-dependent methyltransferase [Hydrogenophilales bacterium CG12_big_fil_r